MNVSPMAKRLDSVEEVIEAENVNKKLSDSLLFHSHNI
jgi:hypothetical protein